MAFTQQLWSGASSVVFVLVAMLAVSVCEVLVPARASGPRGRWGPNLALTAIALAANVVLGAALVVLLAALEARGLGLLAALPRALGLAITVVVLDLATWVAHVAMHHVAWMWRFHRVHHCDAMVDVTTTIRQHPGESLIRFAFVAAAAVALGASPGAFAVYRIVSVLFAILEHMNVRLPTWLDGALATVVTSPDMHKVHHSRRTHETNSNYGNISSVWDRVFRTFESPRRRRDVAFGLDGLDDRRTTASLLRLPFADESP